MFKYALYQVIQSELDWDACPEISREMLEQYAVQANPLAKRLGSECPVCHAKHAMPSQRCIPCNSTDCIRIMAEQNVGNDIQDMIRSDPVAVDLIISFAYLATYSKHDMYDLFPSRFQTVHDTQDTGTQTGTQKYAGFLEALDRLPSVDIMVHLIESGDFMAFMHETVFMKESYHVLYWLLNSNRTAIRHISASDQTEDEQTLAGSRSETRLFAIVNTPEKEQSFIDACKAEKDADSASEGVERVYHGSSITSWHSIIQRSLQSYSGTERQAHGAIYGNGVYLSTRVNTAMQYCHTSTSAPSWPQSNLSLHKCYLVIDHVKNKGAHPPRAPPDFRVEPNSNNIINRYIVCTSSE
jgi:poly [ADP-ribose] polymerase 6/8